MLALAPPVPGLLVPVLRLSLLARWSRGWLIGLPSAHRGRPAVRPFVIDPAKGYQTLERPVLTG